MLEGLKFLQIFLNQCPCNIVPSFLRIACRYVCICLCVSLCHCLFFIRHALCFLSIVLTYSLSQVDFFFFFIHAPNMYLHYFCVLLVFSNSNHMQQNEKSFSLKTMEDGQVLLYSVSTSFNCMHTELFSPFDKRCSKRFPITFLSFF